ncbi:MAG: tRNA glutamyl-Q(34) synthetase GluQRS [Ponticaulis sp.]|nr:tRNA glutamyl-Q(34) synthetase GluQRS [Ponticaulis sp.]
MFRTRFAPSPTGYLHEGHALSANEAFSAALEADGDCLLRIEDIDQTRCRPEFETAIFEDLHWLGFEWPAPVRRQSDHFTEYQAALEQLTGLGLTYRCFLTRKALEAELEARGIGPSPAGDRPYVRRNDDVSEDEVLSRVAAGEPFAWRLSLAACRDFLGDEFSKLSFIEEGDGENISFGETMAHPEWLGDVVLARKDSPTSYHLAVTHDDHLQGVSHVVRGADLYHATHMHVLLQRLMNWSKPVYRHHKLLMGEDGRKLSKAHRSKSLRELRKEGVEPSELLKR